MAGMIATAGVSSLLVGAAGEQYPLNAARVPVPWVPLGPRGRRSGRIDVVLQTAPDAIRLTVRDDGRGLPADFARRGGLGWASIHHRASVVGARLYAASPEGGGTEVHLEYEHVAVARE
jgi:hypothetical protein